MIDEYGWQEYVPANRGRGNDLPFVSMRGPDLFLNSVAFAMLGNPKEVTILIDKLKRRIGFRVGKGFVLRAHRRIHAGGLSDELPGIGDNRRIPLMLRDGVLASDPIELSVPGGEVNG